MAKQLYTVQPGDYLRKIARDQLGDGNRWAEIAYINSLEQPYIINTGQVLLLPNDTEPLEVIVTEGIKPNNGAATQKAALTISPATIALAALVAAAVFIWSRR